MQNLIKMSASYPSKFFRLSYEEMPPLTRLDYAAELVAHTRLKGFQESTKKFIFLINTNKKHGAYKFTSVPKNLTQTSQQFKT
jgi:hypothetical protein